MKNKKFIRIPSFLQYLNEQLSTHSREIIDDAYPRKYGPSGKNMHDHLPWNEHNQIVVPLVSNLQKEVQEHLDTLGMGHKIDDWGSGTASYTTTYTGGEFKGQPKKVTKNISTLLGSAIGSDGEPLLHKFNERLPNESDHVIVYSRDRYDVGGMSEEKNWKSCQSLDSPLSDLCSGLSKGTIASYVVHKDAKQSDGRYDVDDAKARIAFRPVFAARDTKILSSSLGRIYGNKIPGFLENGKEFIAKHFPRMVNTVYKFEPGVYDEKHPDESMMGPIDLTKVNKINEIDAYDILRIAPSLYPHFVSHKSPHIKAQVNVIAHSREDYSHDATFLRQGYNLRNLARYTKNADVYRKLLKHRDHKGTALKNLNFPDQSIKHWLSLNGGDRKRYADNIQNALYTAKSTSFSSSDYDKVFYGLQHYGIAKSPSSGGFTHNFSIYALPNHFVDNAPKNYLHHLAKIIRSNKYPTSPTMQMHYNAAIKFLPALKKYGIIDDHTIAKNLYISTYH